MAPVQHTTGSAGTAASEDAAATPCTDLSLMERIQADDAGAFGELFERYWAPLLVFAQRIVRRHDAAKDVVQESFLKLWHHRGSWTPSGTVNGYLYRITRNLALNEERRLQTQKGWAERHAVDVPRAASPASPAEIFATEAARKRVEEAILSLPPRRRQVFVLARFKGHSYGEIAKIMSISPQTVANQMSAALADLRATLADD